ncbi:MAG: hypothetical protein NTX05_07350 [Fusobacteria bacterium]|nr:hypothetical protein [Fusobacteriota bacterium]
MKLKNKIVIICIAIVIILLLAQYFVGGGKSISGNEIKATTNIGNSF